MFKDFAAGDIFTANDADAMLRQGIVPVADAAARDAIPSPHVGMLIYRIDLAQNEIRTSSGWEKFAGTESDLKATIAELTFTSVKAFGAVGDATTDDTDAVQTAIDYLQSLPAPRAYGRVLYFPPGIYRVTTITITGSNVRLLGAGFNDSLIVRDVTNGSGTRIVPDQYNMTLPSGRAVIEVEASGFALESLAVKAWGSGGVWPSGSGSTILDAGLRLRTSAREVGGVTYRERSLDAHLESVYLSGWGTGAIVEGQGFTVNDSLVTLNRDSFTLDFPRVWCIGSTTLHNDDGTADLRTFIFTNNRTQANSGPFVRNEGFAAAKIQSLVIDGWVGDIGGEIFAGNLSNSTIRNFVNQQGQQGEDGVIRLTSGLNENFRIENGVIQGMGNSDQDISLNYPTVGIKLVSGATISGGYIGQIQFISIGRYGIWFEDTVSDLELAFLWFEDCGHASAGPRGAIRFEGSGDSLRATGIRLNDTGTSAYTLLSSSSVGGSYIFYDIRRVGNATSLAAGFGAPQGIVFNDTAFAAPSSGTWRRGDVVRNANAAVGARQGWVCTVAGTPGTWTELPNL